MSAGHAPLPPLALGGALLLWGWQCQLVAVAVPMALALEAARLVRWRWELSNRDFHRVADLSGVALALVIVYQFDANGLRGIYAVLEWLPAVIFLLTAAQAYSTASTVPYTALFLSVRRAAARGRLVRPGGIDMHVPCLVACLIAATAGPERSPGAFWASAAVVAWTLWPQRSRRFAPWVWGLALTLALGLGHAGQLGVVGARQALEPVMMSWFHEYLLARRDPYRAYTAMGQIGRLKLSDRIVLRVSTDGRPGVPPLLRTATYRSFARNMWAAHAREFRPVASDVEGTRWPLSQAGGADERTLTISTYMRFGKGLVPAPTGVTALEELPVEQVFRNGLGTLKVLKGPGHVEYVARYAEGVGGDDRPGRPDLSVPPRDEALVRGIVERLGLVGREPEAVVAGLQRYFAEGFRYSVVLRRPTRELEPLHDFLTETRTGHCEFFASSTVLLLRAAGVPARYATGYAVQEWSELDDAYVVRKRHGHSWAIAYIDGAWRDVDTTPAIWAELEAESAPWWEDVYDLWSRAGYHLARWRWSPGEGRWTTWALWLLVPLTVLLAWRLYRGDRVRTGAKAGRPERPERRGLDSALLGLERELGARGHGRSPGESLADWLSRLERDGAVEGAGDLAREALPAHYAYRFGPPAGVDAAREGVREAVARWRDGRPDREIAR